VCVCFWGGGRQVARERGATGCSGYRKDAAVVCCCEGPIPTQTGVRVGSYSQGGVGFGSHSQGQSHGNRWGSERGVIFCCDHRLHHPCTQLAEACCERSAWCVLSKYSSTSCGPPPPPPPLLGFTTPCCCCCRDAGLMVVVLKVLRHELLFYGGVFQGQLDKDTLDKVCVCGGGGKGEKGGEGRGVKRYCCGVFSAVNCTTLCVCWTAGPSTTYFVGCVTAATAASAAAVVCICSGVWCVG